MTNRAGSEDPPTQDLRDAGAADSGPSMRRLRLLGLPAVVWLVLSCGAVYAGLLSGPLLFDDESSITANPTLRGWHFPDVLFAPRENPLAGRPLANLSFAAGIALLGESSTAHHATNLALHMLVTWLGFVLVRMTLAHGRVPPELTEHAGTLAFTAACLFGVHPLGVELVQYATQRTELLMAVFYLAALALLAHAAATRRVTPQVIVLTALCSLLGACSKEVFATAPVLALFFDRAFFGGSFAVALRARGKLYLLLALGLLPLWILQRTHPRPLSVGPVTLDYLLAQAQIIPGYLTHALWPARSVLDYGPLLPQNAEAAAPWVVLTLLLLLTAAVLAFVKPRLGWLGVTVFGLLAPSSSIFTVHTEVGAERRIYLALIALLAYAVVGIYALLRRAFGEHSERVSLVSSVMACCAVLALGVQARAYASTFASQEQAWTAAVEARPDNPRAHYNLGETYRRQGELPLAEQAYRNALARNERYHEAHSNLGNLLLARGKLPEGLSHLARAVELAPSDATARANYGVALAMSGELPRARTQLTAALSLEPRNAATRNKLARVVQALAAAEPKGAPSARADVHATAGAWPGVTLFAPRGTWLGADGAYSIDLREGRTLWLWGDTFIDPRADGSRVNGPNFFVRNGCAIQSSDIATHAQDPTRASMAFYFGPEQHGAPSSCLHDVDGDKQWLWPLHGARLPSGELLLFRMHVHAVTGGFGFALAGWDAVAVDDPTLAPDRWKPRVIARLTTEPHVLVGSSVLVWRDYLYAYATRNDPSRPQDHAMFLARWPLARLSRLQAGALSDPEWWCGERGFSTQPACTAPVALWRDGQVELSVHYDPRLSRFIEVQMSGLLLSDPSTQLVLRTANAPEGPWSEPAPLFRPTEAGRSDAKSLVAYAAKAHPEATADGALLVTYVVNDLAHLPPGDDLYYPRAVRVQLSPAGQNPPAQ